MCDDGALSKDNRKDISRTITWKNVLLCPTAAILSVIISPIHLFVQVVHPLYCSIPHIDWFPRVLLVIESHEHCFIRPAVKDTQLRRRSTTMSNQPLPVVWKNHSLIPSPPTASENRHPLPPNHEHILTQWCISHLTGAEVHDYEANLGFFAFIVRVHPVKGLVSWTWSNRKAKGQ